MDMVGMEWEGGYLHIIPFSVFKGGSWNCGYWEGICKQREDKI